MLNISLIILVGTQYSFDKRVQYLVGITGSFGHEKRVNAHIGLCYSNKQVLKSGYQENVLFANALSDKEKITNTVFNQTAYFSFGISYALNFKKLVNAFSSSNKRNDIDSEPTGGSQANKK